jgi:polyhydroxybutyrate depolymerase
MGRALRGSLIGGALLVVALGAAYGYFLHSPTPEPPPLGSVARHDSLRVGDRTRGYTFYIPAGLAPGAPLVLALHGATGDAEQMRRFTGYGFERLADQHGFVVVYPEGYERHWNDCRTQAPYAARRLDIDDVGFMRALVAHFHASHGVDPDRVYAVGYSNGAHLGYRIALEAPELVSAVAAAAANLPTEENSDCTPRGRPPPVLILNGTGDPINPYDGGRVTLFGFADRGSVRSARETAAYFAERHAIRDGPLVQVIPGEGRSRTSAERARWRSAGGAEVVLLTIHGGGHTLPHPGAHFPRILGRTHRRIDGPAEIWDFFARHGGAPQT